MNQCKFLGNYEFKEQYDIYDGDALIADIGGYLGLLLGLSLFTIFQFFLSGILRAKDYLIKGKKTDLCVRDGVTTK